jgi:hypothetical protein
MEPSIRDIRRPVETYRSLWLPSFWLDELYRSDIRDILLQAHIATGHLHPAFPLRASCNRSPSSPDEGRATPIPTSHLASREQMWNTAAHVLEPDFRPWRP